jgi:hypothetical protein
MSKHIFDKSKLPKVPECKICRQPAEHCINGGWFCNLCVKYLQASDQCLISAIKPKHKCFCCTKPAESYIYNKWVCGKCLIKINDNDFNDTHKALTAEDFQYVTEPETTMTESEFNRAWRG